MAIEQTKTLQQFGVTLAESARYKTISREFGTGLAEQELHNNLKSYEREFLMDEALSLPHTYHIIDQQLYSADNRHPLFHIASQIDDRERGGATKKGFLQFEQIVAQSPSDSVALWYSPDGPSGFPGVEFDSGRLYVSLKTDESTSVNFDIKTRPQFPILPFLGQIHEITEGEHPRFDSPEAGKMYYLSHPMDTHMTIDGFFQFVTDYASDKSEPLYVSRRNSSSPVPRSFLSVTQEMIGLFGAFNPDDKPSITYDQTYNPMNEEELLKRYVAVIQPYLKRDNGQVVLYGCSTTSTVSEGDVASILQGPSLQSLISSYSTQNRLMTTTSPFSSYESSASFPCPKCGKAIPSGRGITTCPHCGITKEQYAKDSGTASCA